jgi:hypothetical protein
MCQLLRDHTEGLSRCRAFPKVRPPRNRVHRPVRRELPFWATKNDRQLS